MAFPRLFTHNDDDTSADTCADAVQGETARPANAQPLSGTSTSGTVGTGGSNEPLAATTSLRSTTGGTSTLVGAAGGNAGTEPGRVSIDGTQSDAGELQISHVVPSGRCSDVTGHLAASH